MIFFNLAYEILYIHRRAHALQVIVSSARVRLRLDPGKVAELLQGMSAESMGSQFASGAANVLRCLGDLGNLSFTPLPPGVTLSPSSPLVLQPSSWAVPVHRSQEHGRSSVFCV